MLASIFGLAGPELSADERALFRDAEAAGYILFRRNCVDQAQLLRLTDELRTIAGRADVPILIDQEGGRVARMRPPVWPAFPTGEAFARLYQAAPSSAIEAVRSNARALALTLQSCGINVNCLPLLDVRQEGADDIIGDRALGSEPMQVSALGRATLEGMASAGVVGVVKHMPGHGRALVDSHKELPVVDATSDELVVDLEPFERLRTAPMGMMAHVIYTAWDAKRPSSLSPIVIEEIVRGRIGFDGWLMSDDLGMEALSGSAAERATGVVSAGCDVALHCSGEFSEMAAIADAAPQMSSVGEERLARAMGSVAAVDEGMDYAEAAAKRDALLALA